MSGYSHTLPHSWALILARILANPCLGREPQAKVTTLALMLNLYFKSLDVVKGFVGRAKIIHMVAKYDNKSLMPLLVATFKIQNLGVITY